jgi:hypothetical protein
MATTDTQRLKTFVGLIYDGKFDTARNMISEKVVVREPAALPYGGDHVGLDGFDRFLSLVAATWTRWVDGPMWYAEAAGTVAKCNTITATSRATGRDYSTRLVELYTFEAGLIVEIVVFYQDVPEFLDAIRTDAVE